MKKIFAIILLLAACAWVYLNWAWLVLKFQPAARLQNFSQELRSSPAVGDLQKQIFTSQPLRGQQDAPAAFLTRAGVISQTNLQRAQNQRAVLKENSSLDQAARLKLEDMFSKQYFEHVSPSGAGPGDLAKEVGYDYIDIGENLALGNFQDDKALIQAWMNSPGHRANILNDKFSEIGVAVGQGSFEGKTTWLAVQEFGKPASSCPSVDGNLKNQIAQQQTEVDQLSAELEAEKSSLDAANPKTQGDYQAYNQAVAAYNAQVAIYDNKLDLLKQAVDDYNDQVRAFNSCAAE